MGEKAKIILNDYSAKSLLYRDTLDLDKFYTADLKLMCEIARKEIKELQERIDKAIEYIENNVLTYIDEDGLESITDKEENELIKILRGDKE